MIENENWMIELEEIPFYMLQKKLERIQINFTWKEIIKWNGVFFAFARNSLHIKLAFVLGDQVGGAEMNSLSFSD